MPRRPARPRGSSPPCSWRPSPPPPSPPKGPPAPDRFARRRRARPGAGPGGLAGRLLPQEQPARRPWSLAPADFNVRVQAWLSNSRVSAHANPRRSECRIDGRAGSSAFAEVIASTDEGAPVPRADRAPGLVGPRLRHPGRPGGGTPRRWGPSRSSRAGTSGSGSGSSNQHCLYGDYDPLLGRREVEIKLGAATVADAPPFGPRAISGEAQGSLARAGRGEEGHPPLRHRPRQPPPPGRRARQRLLPLPRPQGPLLDPDEAPVLVPDRPRAPRGRFGPRSSSTAKGRAGRSSPTAARSGTPRSSAAGPRSRRSSGPSPRRRPSPWNSRSSAATSARSGSTTFLARTDRRQGRPPLNRPDQTSGRASCGVRPTAHIDRVGRRRLEPEPLELGGGPAPGDMSSWLTTCRSAAQSGTV